MHARSLNRFRLLFALVAVVPAAAAHSQVRAQVAPPPGDLAAKLDAVERAVDARREELHIPGASLVIVKDDRIIYLKGLGLRDVERRLPVTPDTLFAIGSATKAFTAATVLMSQEQGKLSLADAPRKYLSFFKLRDADADSKITIGDLLCHRSGLERTDLAWAMGRLKPEDVIRVACQAKPTAKFGEKFQYQNVMFLTAGEIAARVQKTPWRELVARRIFRPLGMTATETSIAEMEAAADHAEGYVWSADRADWIHLPMRDVTSIAPAGAINSNARDMARWLRLLLGGGSFEGRRLLSDKSFAAMTSRHMTMTPGMDYGYGWFLHDWDGHRVVEHGGNIDGFNAQVAFMPDQRLGFVLLTNVSASSLGAFTMETVWDRLVGRKSADSNAASAVSAASAAPAGDPAAEVGKYHLALANLDMVVALKDGRLTVTPTGQPQLPLMNRGGRRYMVGPPAPANVFITFHPAKDDPKETEMALEQAGATLLGQKVKEVAFTPPISVDDLLAKVIAAAGGEANLRRRHSVTMRATVDYENQGVVGDMVAYAQAPNLSAETLTYRALGRKIGWERDYFDGKAGGSESSFTIADTTMGVALADDAIKSDFYGPLSWRKLFKTITMTKIEKVGGEDAYVVEMTPEKGSVVTVHVSTGSFLILKQQVGSHPATMFGDYRPVDGVMTAFRRTTVTPGSGTAVITVREVRCDAPIRAAVFRPAPGAPPPDAAPQPEWASIILGPAPMIAGRGER